LAHHGNLHETGIFFFVFVLNPNNVWWKYDYCNAASDVLVSRAPVTQKLSKEEITFDSQIVSGNEGNCFLQQ
jgi:hypothetical protein